MKCEYCKEKHHGDYGSGRFCSKKCACGFSTKEKRKEINFKVSKSLGGKNYKPKEDFCLYCGHELKNKQREYCNSNCYHVYEYLIYINKWKLGLVSGSKCDDLEISNYVRRYLFKKYNSMCQKCDWGIVHDITGKVPLSIHHIDGDCTNNKEENLELLCLNCHSLTYNFGSLNKNNKISRAVRLGL